MIKTTFTAHVISRLYVVATWLQAEEQKDKEVNYEKNTVYRKYHFILFLLSRHMRAIEPNEDWLDY